jgi:murein L,D-transpeptidase YafK
MKKVMKKQFPLFTTLLVFLFLNSCYSKEKAKSQNINACTPLCKLLDSLHIKHSEISIGIVKSQWRLNIIYHSKIIKSYSVVFGDNPLDDKLIQGDGCTPEGSFKVRTKYPHKSWSKFIWIDYPNKDSIKKFNTAIKEGKIPANAKIGGDIGIHGVPKGFDNIIDNRQNWTLGCISLKTCDINEIYPFVFDGMPINITK